MNNYIVGLLHLKPDILKRFPPDLSGTMIVITHRGAEANG
jgi:hypothetical protein